MRHPWASTGLHVLFLLVLGAAVVGGQDHVPATQRSHREQAGPLHDEAQPPRRGERRLLGHGGYHDDEDDDGTDADAAAKRRLMGHAGHHNDDEDDNDGTGDAGGDDCEEDLAIGPLENVRQVHGAVMASAWATAATVGVITARYYRHKQWWFPLHRPVAQTLSRNTHWSHSG